MNRHLKIIFTLSILLNVLLIGVVAGAAYKRMDGPPRFEESRDPAFNHKMAKAMMEARKGQEALFRQMRAARNDMNDALAADVFDEAAFDAASERLYKVQADMFRARNEATLKMAREMDAAERKELVAHFKALSERRGKHGDGKHKAPPSE